MNAAVTSVQSEGAILTFSEPVRLNGKLASKEWWLSWEKIARLITGIFSEARPT